MRLAAAEHEHRRQQAATAVAAIVLELGEAPYAGVPCWTGRLERWVRWTVPVAYDCRYDTEIRPLMPGNPISRQALLTVAEARARYADHATGRNCRPSNERLAADTGLSVRTIQRADTVLRLLGVATEVLRGRQRTRVERLASWRVGDRGRGWASVWALHDYPQLTRLVYRLSPHPRSGPVRDQPSGEKVITTDPGGPAGRRQSGATRRRTPDAGGSALARTWRADTHAPPWARRHTAGAWAALLAGPAAYGWSPRDLNALITDWAAVTGRRIPDHPYKPIGLLGAILAWHGRERLAERPAALDEAREAAELATHHAHLAAQRAAHREHERARAAGRAALGGPGHAAARAVAAEAARRGAHKRTHVVAEAAAQRAAAVAAARTHRRGPGPLG
ncbi:helix-turn-helix domain-containing protein [Mycobacterium avium]|uniref:RepA n=5 Tax=Mycobacteriaceae TaxID=1762 RepID=Q938A1_MYCAV|nr:helix-turn-helix domain-containing protein [Mycobacterium avium]AAL23620.1 RepA [Mycobacterium avium]SIK26999.1 plasmid replication protein [Mycobacteroides abscessus subsp. abscessus]SIL69130.1 plasmid replication protein [Mycobacteroides abscessus subsp. abscessus]